MILLFVDQVKCIAFFLSCYGPDYSAKRAVANTESPSLSYYRVTKFAGVTDFAGTVPYFSFLFIEGWVLGYISVRYLRLSYVNPTYHEAETSPKELQDLLMVFPYSHLKLNNTIG